MKRVYRILFLSIVLAISLPAQGQKFDRGISLTEGPVFIPKNSFLFGGTVSYQNYGFDDYKFLVLEDMNIDAYSLKASPFLYFSVANNQAVGLRFSYGRSMAKLDELNLSLGEDMAFSLGDVYNIKQTYYGSLAYRYYMPIGNSLRFGLFADMSLNCGIGQGKFISGSGENIVGTYQNILDLSMDVIPGIAVFASNEIAVEASVGILGIGYKKVSQVTNQVFEGSYETKGANFKINFLTINLGINIVLPI